MSARGASASLFDFIQLESLLHDAAIAAERVPASFEAAGAVVAGHPLGATVSIGVADGLASACSVEQLLLRAFPISRPPAFPAPRKRILGTAPTLRSRSFRLGAW